MYANVTQPTTSFGGRIAGWLKRRWQRHSEAMEWRSLANEERGRIAHDLAMGASEMTAFMRDSEGSAELETVLARNGLQAGDLLHDMQRVCGLCPDRGRCRDWLAAHQAAQASVPDAARTSWPFFCPNAGTLAELKRRN